MQSILIHENYLFVIVNGSSEIKRYSISKSGLSLPGITISTQNSSPREMVIFNNKLYFTNWNSKDIKVLNLTTYAITEQIPVEGLPEDITTDGTFLYASVPHLVLYDQGNGSSVIKIDPNINRIIETYEVGKGPQQLVIHNNSLWISRTYFSEDWYQTYFGMTQVDLMTNDITKKEYGEGIVCGGIDYQTLTDILKRPLGVAITGMEDNTTIIDGAGSTDQIKGRVDQIKAQIVPSWMIILMKNFLARVSCEI